MNSSLENRRIDLAAYAARIGYAGEMPPTLETLRALHLAHATRVPFENLDLLLGRGISLELADLESKLVGAHRGGYCFEQNSLFAAMLESIGFGVTRLAARVRMGMDFVRPRTHMLLCVDVEGKPWICDVGFGADGMLLPMPLEAREPVQQGVWTLRFTNEGDLRVLQTLHTNGWFDLYAFSMQPQFPVDYVVANHYTSTHPNSPFTNTVLVQRSSLDAGWALVNRQLIVTSPGRRDIEMISDDEALLKTLAEFFGLSFPSGTRFHYIEKPNPLG